MSLLKSYLADAEDIKFAPRLLQEWSTKHKMYVLSEHWDLELGYVDLIKAHAALKGYSSLDPLRWLKRLESHHKVVSKLADHGHPPLMDYNLKDLFFVREVERLLVHPTLASLYMGSPPTLDLIRSDETIEIEGIPVHSSTTGLYLVTDWPNRGYRLENRMTPFAYFMNSKCRRRMDATIDGGKSVRYVRMGRHGYHLVDEQTTLHFKEFIETRNLVKL